MDEYRMTIGELSRRAGRSVKTIRFYSDSGLLPPSERSGSGYRLYSERDLLRLELILTLREAGVDLHTIEAVLEEDMDLDQALKVRLTAIEAHVTSLTQVAAAIRAALRSGASHDDLRRLHKVTQLSDEERRTVIHRMYDRISEGISMDEEWKREMVEASAPRLPDDPTPEQLDAWIEMAEIANDPGFVESMRKNASETWTDDFDTQSYRAAGDRAVAAARRAIDEGLTPDSLDAASVVDQYVAGFAAALQQEPDEAFRHSIYERFENHDPRASRYWELVAIMNGQPVTSSPNEEWNWIAEAVKAHLR